MKRKYREGKNEEFKHRINAFLSLARSVIFVLQKEFKKHKGFVKWYESEKGQKFKDEKLKIFVDLRNIRLKEEPINPRYVFGVLFENGIKLSPNDEFTIKTDVSNYISHQ